MKKKNVLIITLLLILGVIISFIAYKSNYAISFDSNHLKLAVMVQNETDDGYSIWNNETWPQDGNYKLNEDLSNCENGSNLELNIDNKSVILKASKSDKCSITFDKEEPLKILSANVTTMEMMIYVDITLNKSVDIKDVYLILDNTHIYNNFLNPYETHYTVCSYDNGFNICDNRGTHNYELYVVSTSLEKSESIYGSFTSGSNICGPC